MATTNFRANIPKERECRDIDWEPRHLFALRSSGGRGIADAMDAVGPLGERIAFDFRGRGLILQP
jgi:hypothetical protein